MAIKVKFFASLREQMGTETLELPFGGSVTVAEVWQQVSTDVDLSGKILMAVNMEYADGAKQVNDGDEVAFFPPVTGG